MIIVAIKMHLQECSRCHFKAISDNGYIYDVAKDYKSLYDIVTK